MKGTTVTQRPGGFAISDILELDRAHPTAATGLDQHPGGGGTGTLDPVLYPPHHNQLPELSVGAPTTIIAPVPFPTAATNHRHWTSTVSPNNINDHGKKIANYDFICLYRLKK